MYIFCTPVLLFIRDTVSKTWDWKVQTGYWVTCTVVVRVLTLQGHRQKSLCTDLLYHVVWLTTNCLILHPQQSSLVTQLMLMITCNVFNDRQQQNLAKTLFMFPFRYIFPRVVQLLLCAILSVALCSWKTTATTTRVH